MGWLNTIASGAGAIVDNTPYSVPVIGTANALWDVAKYAGTPQGQQQAGVASSPSTTYAGGGGGSYDPYAAQRAAAEATRVRNLHNQVNQGQENAVATGNSSANAYRDSYRLQNQGIVSQWRNANDSYNQNRTNTALNTRRGISGVISGVRQGLQGAMTGLPDSALDSGATGALARSWNKQGQQQASGVYNEAAMQNQETERGYQRAKEDRDRSIGNLGIDRGSKVEAISNQLLSDLRTIDINAQAQPGGGGLVNYGLRDAVINRAIADLNNLDQQRTQELGQYNPLSNEQILAEAVRLDQAGAVPFNAFTLPTEEAMVADPGAPVSQIPFYTRRRDEV